MGLSGLFNGAQVIMKSIMTFIGSILAIGGITYLMHSIYLDSMELYCHPQRSWSIENRDDMFLSYTPIWIFYTCTGVFGARLLFKNRDCKYRNWIGMGLFCPLISLIIISSNMFSGLNFIVLILSPILFLFPVLSLLESEKKQLAFYIFSFNAFWLIQAVLYGMDLDDLTGMPYF